MNRTPLLILKQDAKEDVYFLSARDAQETNQRRKKCLQILKVNHIIIIMILYSILVNPKIKREFPT